MMVQATASPILQFIRRTVDDERLRDLPDPELLQRFHDHEDQAAFKVLLRRHGRSVGKGTASPAAGESGSLVIRRAPGMSGSGTAVVTKRASSGWRFKTRSTLETDPNCVSPKLKRMAGSPRPPPEKAW